MSGDDRQRIADAVADATRMRMAGAPPEQLDRGWDRLDRALSEGRYPSVRVVSPRRRWWLPGLALAAAGVMLAVVVHRGSPGRDGRPIAYVVESATLGPNATITTSTDSPGRLLFTDESRIRMAPATRVAVVGRDAHGARVVLADGALDVEIRHRRGAAWRFDAGPFSVNVIGTAFHLGFDAGRGRLLLQMVSGVVQASGPGADDVTLRAGQSLELYVPAPRAAAEPAAPAPLAPTALAPSLAPPTNEASDARPGSAARRRVGHVDRAPAAQPEDWPRLIARGDFAGVVKDAEARGIDAVLATGSAAELNALADAARYTRRNDLARQALLGLRARFSGTARASDAAFFLGRLAELGPASPAAAVNWYDTYLDEAGRGPYAGEALAREIAILAPTDRARARRAAQLYLERFPHGSQAELARSLLTSP